MHMRAFRHSTIRGNTRQAGSLLGTIKGRGPCGTAWWSWNTFILILLILPQTTSLAITTRRLTIDCLCLNESHRK